MLLSRARVLFLPFSVFSSLVSGKYTSGSDPDPHNLPRPCLPLLFALVSVSSICLNRFYLVPSCFLHYFYCFLDAIFRFFSLISRYLPCSGGFPHSAAITLLESWHPKRNPANSSIQIPAPNILRSSRGNSVFNLPGTYFLSVD